VCSGLRLCSSHRMKSMEIEPALPGVENRGLVGGVFEKPCKGRTVCSGFSTMLSHRKMKEANWKIERMSKSIVGWECSRLH